MGGSDKVKHYFKNPVSGGLDLITGTYDMEKSAEKEARRQQAMILRQQQMERLKLAESEDEVKRRKYLARAGGRRSLISPPSDTAPTKGTTTLLGG